MSRTKTVGWVRATKWILNDDLRKTLHFESIAVGVAGYFMEGCKGIAQATLAEVFPGLTKVV